MLQRLALFAGSLAVAFTIAAAAAITGHTPSRAAPVASSVVLDAPAPADPASTPKVDTVYLTTPAQKTVVVSKVVHGAGGETEGAETEGAGGSD